VAIRANGKKIPNLFSGLTRRVNQAGDTVHIEAASSPLEVKVVWVSKHGHSPAVRPVPLRGEKLLAASRMNAGT
jgi:hypothetical protein